MIKEMNSLTKFNGKKIMILPKLTLLTISMMIVLGNSATFSLQSIYKGMPIKIVEVLMGINLIFLLLNLIPLIGKDTSKLQKEKANYRYSKIIIIWTLFGAISALVNSFFYNYTGKELAYGGLYSIRLIFYIAYTVIAIKYLILQGVTLTRFIKTMVGSYLIVAIFGFIQLAIWPNAMDFYRFLSKFGVYLLNPDPHVNRLISTYLDPNFLGSILLIPIGICVAFVFESKRKYKWIITLIVLLVADFLTVSRSGILGLVLFIVIFLGLSSIHRGKSKNIVINIKIFFSTLTIFLSLPIIYSFINNSRIFERILGVASDPSALARISSWNRKNIFYLSNEMIAIFIGSIAMSFFNNLLLLALWIAPFLLIISMIFQSENKNEQQGRYV